MPESAADAGFGFRPVVIIGAARSGTNMLRDVLVSLPGVTTWPCDEIPYVWRQGNRDHPDDEFDAAMARPRVRRAIRRTFGRLADRDTGWVVEKTCANSLRPAFVDAVLPEARFLFIHRSGPDAAASAMLRWRAAFDLRYSLAKARYVPPADLPHYAVRFLANRLRRLTRRDRRLGIWGPVYRGMRDLAPDTPLAEVAAWQWRHCVERSDDQLGALAPGRVHRVRYEDFVTAPAANLADILAFLELDAAPEAVAAAVAGVRGSSVGKGLRSLAPADRERILGITAPAMARFGDAARGTAP